MTIPFDVRSYNREAWNRQVASGNRWTLPVSSEVIAAARRGEWSVVLTPTKPVPREWFGDIRGKRVLGLASAGGQQVPVFAAAGAQVTSFDNSPAQLGQDRLVAEREGLSIELVEGDMRDLSAFADGSFDLIFHPVSNTFCPELAPVWRECFRVLRPGGVLLAGFVNPDLYIFDEVALYERDELVVRNRVPYSTLELSDVDCERVGRVGKPIEFSHTLTEQIGGQLASGFRLTHFVETPHHSDLTARYLPGYFATRAVKP